MTDSARYEVAALGNAIFDVLAHVDEAFLNYNELTKGSMMLIDAAQAEQLYAMMGTAVRVSGGSAANSVACIASLGGQAAFIGKVAEDQVGRDFAHDIRGIGVHFDTPALAVSEGIPTARSFILVTPDGERTMNTYLGAAQNLGPDDVDPAIITNAEITFLEGYLWDPKDAKEAFRVASSMARKAGRKVALTLSDTFCVDRYRDEFIGLMRDKSLDIVFANEHELRALYQTSDFDTAFKAFQEDIPTGIVTRGAQGATGFANGEVVSVPAAKPTSVTDLTGAGDLFAGGALLGLARGKPLQDAMNIGVHCAAEVISHLGARPETELKALLEGQGVNV